MGGAQKKENKISEMYQKLWGKRKTKHRYVSEDEEEWDAKNNEK